MSQLSNGYCLLKSRNPIMTQLMQPLGQFSRSERKKMSRLELGQPGDSWRIWEAMRMADPVDISLTLLVGSHWHPVNSLAENQLGNITTHWHPSWSTISPEAIHITGLFENEATGRTLTNLVEL